jgi:hypothetical protein
VDESIGAFLQSEYDVVVVVEGQGPHEEATKLEAFRAPSIRSASADGVDGLVFHALAARGKHPTRARYCRHDRARSSLPRRPAGLCGVAIIGCHAQQRFRLPASFLSRMGRWALAVIALTAMRGSRTRAPSSSFGGYYRAVLPESAWPRLAQIALNWGACDAARDPQRRRARIRSFTTVGDCCSGPPLPPSSSSGIVRGCCCCRPASRAGPVLWSWDCSAGSASSSSCFLRQS